MKDESIIKFIEKTTEALTMMQQNSRETNKAFNENLQKLTESHISHAQETKAGFKSNDDKIEGLKTLFKYVIVPLVTGILSLVGIKLIFNL